MTVLELEGKIAKCKEELKDLDRKLAIARGDKYLKFMSEHSTYAAGVDLDLFAFYDEILPEKPLSFECEPCKKLTLRFDDMFVIGSTYFKSYGSGGEEISIAIEYDITGLDAAISHFECGGGQFYEFARSMFPDGNLQSVEFMCSPSTFTFSADSNVVHDMEIYHGFICSKIALAPAHFKFRDIFAKASNLARFKHLTVADLGESPFQDHFSRIVSWRSDCLAHLSPSK